MKFTAGKQPCSEYNPMRTGNEYAVWDNEHECCCPFDGTSPCDGTVSFCENCSSDHHSNGYETCKGCQDKSADEVSG